MQQVDDTNHYSDSLSFADQLWINDIFCRDVFKTAGHCPNFCIYSKPLSSRIPLGIVILVHIVHCYSMLPQNGMIGLKSFIQSSMIFNAFLFQIVASPFLQKTTGKKRAVRCEFSHPLAVTTPGENPGVIWWWVSFMSCVSWEWWMSTWRVPGYTETNIKSQPENGWLEEDIVSLWGGGRNFRGNVMLL